MCIDLTVIIPYYNENKTILKTIDLVSRQSISPMEVIFVDSNSFDESSKTIENWINKNNKNYSTNYKNVNKGSRDPGSSKNVGIGLAKTKWIAFMDCGLLFELDWLEKQWDYIEKYKYDIVSGVCLLEGRGPIDSAAVSQTYGYKRKRPCVPGTLLKKSVFDKTGLFLENRRAGYDSDWLLSIKKMNLFRGINWDVIVRYNGINFANSFLGVLKKSIKYSIPTVGLRYYNLSYYYILFFTIFILTLNFSYSIALQLFIVYLLFRGFLVPIIKSRSLNGFYCYYYMIVLIPIIGILIDFGKTIGIFIGIKKYHF